MAMVTQKITLGAGCFWCIEGSFRKLRGVNSAISGYTGGNTANPDYNSICTGTTNHAEVVQVEYVPSVISTDQILQIFFFLHDPTQWNRQGNDVGTQYRSAIFYHDDEQKSVSEKMIAELNASGKYKSPIVTQLAKLGTFYPAEDYHQDYFNKSGAGNGYCQAVVGPKISKFVKTYKQFLKE